jgi:hypothetical protein
VRLINSVYIFVFKLLTQYGVRPWKMPTKLASVAKAKFLRATFTDCLPQDDDFETQDEAKDGSVDDVLDKDEREADEDEKEADDAIEDENIDSQDNLEDERSSVGHSGSEPECGTLSETHYRLRLVFTAWRQTQRVKDVLDYLVRLSWVAAERNNPALDLWS